MELVRNIKKHSSQFQGSIKIVKRFVNDSENLI